MNFGFNEDNLEVEYDDEKNDLKKDYDDKRDLQSHSQIQNKDPIPANKTKNYSFIININNKNIFKYSEIDKNINLKSFNDRKEKINEELLNKKLKDNKFDNNINKNIVINNKNFIENSSYFNILKLIIDNNQNIFNNSIIISKNKSFIKYI